MTGETAADVEIVPTARPRMDEGGLSSFIARFRPRTITHWIGFLLVVGWVLLATFAPLLTSYDPIAQDFTALLQPPSPTHVFGTDQLGRDIYSRVLFGGRATLPIGVAIIGIALVIGIPIGAFAGYARGWVDEGLMRIADIFLAFPTIVLALAIAAALGPDLASAVVAIAVVLWPRYARLVRGQVLSLKERDFVLANRGLGASPRRILVRTVLPNVLPVVTFVAILDIGGATLAGATLSFLGLGIRPPNPEWGAMVSLATQYPGDWWMSAFPGFALISFVVGINLYGEVLERASERATGAGS
jgi:peptide/nickel transport system permease protein